MDLDQPMKLQQGDKSIELPLKNILRFSMVHLTQLRAEWHMETGDSNIQNFWKWMEHKLDMGQDKTVLM